jgi:hypothetical protein
VYAAVLQSIRERVAALAEDVGEITAALERAVNQPREQRLVEH